MMALFGKRRNPQATQTIDRATSVAGRAIYMLIHQVAPNAGGMTMAMMTRAKVLNSLGGQANILTTDTKSSYPQIEEHYRESGRIDAQTRILNIYEMLRSRVTTPHAGWRERFDYGAHLAQVRAQSTVVPVNGKSVTERRYFRKQDSAYVLYERVNKNGRVEVIEFFNDAHTRVERWTFDQNETLYRTEHYDPTGHKVIQDKFWSTAGTCYVMRWLGAGDGATYKVLYFGERPDHYREFSNQGDFEHWFLESLTKTDRRPIFIGDGTGAMRKLMRLRADQAIRVMQIHSNHFSIDDDSATIKPDHDFILANSRAIDRVVVLTPEQRDDVTREYDAPNISCIPNAIPASPPRRGASEQSRGGRIVIITRLAKEKQLDKAIEAFALVLRDIPTAKFDVYGTGPEEATLRDLVETLGLSECVRFHGFTADVAAAYRHATISVMTSAYEGQGLAMGESLAHGVPAVAFDFSYGPRNYLGDDEAGLVVPSGDVPALARAMTDLLVDSTKRNAMAEAGIRRINGSFSPTSVAQQWGALFMELDQ